MTNKNIEYEFKEIKNILQRLAIKVSVVNTIQNLGVEIKPKDWSDLYQLTNEAFRVLGK